MPGEEGVIYGYNRHLYGGIEPSTMKSFTITTVSDMETGEPVGATINATPPDDTIVDEEVLCSVAGTKLIYNLYHEPANEFDGEVITELKPGETLSRYSWSPGRVDGIIPTAFLKAFPYSTNNVYGRNSKNCRIFNPPPAVDSLSVTQTFDSEAQKYNVNLSATVPTVINKVVVGRINGTLMGESPITPEECEKTWVIEKNAMLSAGNFQVAVIADTEVESAQQYTYIVFPSISNDIYNSDATNRISVTVSDATPPGDLSYVAAYSTDLEGEMQLSVSWPSGECSGVRFVIKKTSFPININDGENFDLVKNLDLDPIKKINNLIPGDTYYVRAFPYIDNDGDIIYNTNNSIKHRTEITLRQHTYLFGFDLDEDNPDYDTRVTYPVDVDNYGWGRMIYNTATSELSFGGWTEIQTAGKWFVPKPCMLNWNGTVDQYLDPNNYKLTIDGKPSLIQDTTAQSNAMMEWGRIYTKRWETGEEGAKIYHFRVSDMAIDSDYDCWCNYNRHNQRTSKFYTAIYYSVANHQEALTGTTKTVLRSVSQYGVTSPLKVNRASTASSQSSFDTMHNEIGYGWYYVTLAQWELMTDLLTMLVKSSRTSSYLGNGRLNNNNKPYYANPPGITDTKGLWSVKHASSTDTTVFQKLFGMENLYGLYGFWPVGLEYGARKISDTDATNNYTYWSVQITPTAIENPDVNHDDSYADFNHQNIIPYMELSPHVTDGSQAIEYPKYFKVFKWGRLPLSQETASSSTYEGTYSSLNNAKMAYDKSVRFFGEYSGGKYTLNMLGMQLFEYSSSGWGSDSAKTAAYRLCYIPEDGENI